MKKFIFSRSQQQIELLLPISDGQKVNHLRLEPERFCLGCGPVVNLFPKIIDPFKLDRQKMKYRLVPDQRRERTAEIHSILGVFSNDSQKTDPILVMSYFFSLIISR